MTTHLRPMTGVEYAGWVEPMIVRFAGDLARATGVPRADALDRARTQFPAILPDGLETPHAWLFVIVDGHDVDVGTLWLGQSPEQVSTGYVFDIVIDAARRGEGLGRDAMLLAEDILRDAGFERIGLSVFGFNTGPRALYDSLGYEPIATTMSKPL